MIGVSLSRWTMSFFAAALAALLLAQGLMAAGYGYPAAPVESARTLVVVHVTAIGWLSLLMCGALLQFVPVLINRPLFSNALSLPTLLCVVGGLGALLAGFLSRELLSRIARALDVPDAELRAALAASQVAGMLVARYVLRLPALAEASVDDLVGRVAPTIQRYLYE